MRLTHSFYRDQAFSYCNVDSDHSPHGVCIEERSKNRVWVNAQELGRFIMTHPANRNLRGPHFVNFSNLTYCEQVIFMHKCLLFVAHHGASVAGNGLHISPGSVIIEIQERYSGKNLSNTVDPIFATSNQGLFHSIGGNYLGARVAYPITKKEGRPCHPDYYFRADCVVQVDYERMQVALDGLLRFFHTEEKEEGGSKNDVMRTKEERRKHE